MESKQPNNVALISLFGESVFSFGDNKCASNNESDDNEKKQIKHV
tara:strand:- start:59940 stop:60074 length:135 start_codon:yes stop_codon:yes gene_type:complete